MEKVRDALMTHFPDIKCSHLNCRILESERVMTMAPIDGPISSPEPNPATRGRPFENGNPGRPRGSKNKATMIVSRLLEAEAKNLIRVAIRLALNGDKDMIKFLLGRVLPKERAIRLEFEPIIYADDAANALAGLTNSVARGELSPSEGAAVGSLIVSYSNALDFAELERHTDELEKRLIYDYPEQV
jgi:hypothetical protein